VLRNNNYFLEEDFDKIKRKKSQTEGKIGNPPWKNTKTKKQQRKKEKIIGTKHLKLPTSVPGNLQTQGQ